MNGKEPTSAQIKYAEKLMAELGYEDSDVHEIFGKDFDDLSMYEMRLLIDMLKNELEG